MLMVYALPPDDANLPDVSVVRVDAPPFGPLLDQQGTYAPDLPFAQDLRAGVVAGVGDPGGTVTGTLVIPSIPNPLTGVMNFRVVNQAILDTLGLSAAGRFTVVGYRRQGKDSEEIRGSKRMVQSFFSSGSFPKSGGRVSGPTQHQMTFNLSMSVSAPARADMNAINTPGATPQAISAALAAMTEAASEADNLLDELAELVYQILMDGRNLDLGLPVGTVSNRWVDSINKNDPLPQGSLVVLTGVMQFTCQTVEHPAGDVGTVANNITTTVDMPGDTIQSTAVTAN